MNADESLDIQQALLERTLAGDQTALAELYDGHRERLQRMVELRMDRRVRGRVSASDVIQETYVDLASQLSNYARDPRLPFFIWIRKLAGQRLAKAHREHLGAAKRNASLEISIYDGPMPEATSLVLAANLIGRFTSASAEVMRAERQLKLQEILNTLDPTDREILAMRHYEQLSNGEVAAVLGISESAAGMRHLRALRRLLSAVRGFPEFFDVESDPSNSLGAEE